MALSTIGSHDASTAGARTQVLAVGDWQQSEFASAKADIPDALDWSLTANIHEACDLLRNCQQPPELIFLAHPLPGLFCQADIDRLQSLVSLTRLVLVAGTWCEGELRTGTLPSGVIRLYWYELAPWWQANVRRRAAGLSPLWSLPLDHAQAGRWSSDKGLPPIQSLRSNAIRSVLIHTIDYAVYETLSAALEARGIESSWNGQAASGTLSVTAGIWDGGQLSNPELAHLTRFCQQISGPVLALLDFPRVEHFQQAEAAGAAAVFAKPYVVEELIMALATPPSRSATKSLSATLARVPASSESS